MDATIWYRIDKGTASITVSSGMNVYRAAAGNYKNPSQVIATGRFNTPLAMYSKGDKLTLQENALLEAQEAMARR